MAKRKQPAKPQKDEVREERIEMEIVVDAYDEDERAMGWCCYLEDKLNVPFRARCIAEREVSPLGVGDEVEVVGFSSESESRREMLVSIRWDKRTLAVPLAQLEVIDGDEPTREAVEDWHYWVAMGYEF
jgi:Calcium binding